LALFITDTTDNNNTLSDVVMKRFNAVNKKDYLETAVSSSQLPNLHMYKLF